MKQDVNKVDVIFLIEYDNDTKSSGITFAYFPQLAWLTVNDRILTFTSYSHVGQHSGCCPEYAAKCIEASPGEYGDLKSELENIGYNLNILN